MSTFGSGYVDLPFEDGSPGDTFTQADVSYGIDGGPSGIYDGVIVWVLKDGRLINAFAGIPGYERRAARIDKFIEETNDV